MAAALDAGVAPNSGKTFELLQSLIEGLEAGDVYSSGAQGFLLLPDVYVLCVFFLIRGVIIRGGRLYAKPVPNRASPSRRTLCCTSRSS